MLDISFYSKNGHLPVVVDVSENFYQWLLNSDFSEIGISCPHTVKVDTEEVSLDVVDLNRGNVSNRHRFREFLVEVIVQEADVVLTQLCHIKSQQDYQKKTYKLRKLQELRKYVEDENYQYLQKF